MDNSKFSITEIKAENRRLKRRLAKLTRKEATMAKLRKDNVQLCRNILATKDSINRISDPMWSPPEDDSYRY